MWNRPENHQLSLNAESPGTVQTSGHTRHINVEHLQLVLVTLRMRRNNPTLAKFCALSNGATWQRCERRYRPNEESPANRWTHSPLLVPMLESVTPKLVERVRLTYGLPEVKRIWGMGYKALLSTLQPKREAA
jgi:hypothetical protein